MMTFKTCARKCCFLGGAGAPAALRAASSLAGAAAPPCTASPAAGSGSAPGTSEIRTERGASTCCSSGETPRPLGARPSVQADGAVAAGRPARRCQGPIQAGGAEASLGLPLRRRRGGRAPLCSCSQPSWASPRHERSGACPSPRSGPCAVPLPAPGFLGAQAVVSGLTSLHQRCSARAGESARGSRSSWPARGAAKVMLRSPSWVLLVRSILGNPSASFWHLPAAHPAGGCAVPGIHRRFPSSFFFFFFSLMCQF